MTSSKKNRVEAVAAAARRRRWPPEEKAAIVRETFAPGMSVSMVARQYGLAPSQVFLWRRTYAQLAPLAGASDEVVSASEYQALERQVRELQRLLGKKTFENEILREALEATHSNKMLQRSM